MIDPVTALAGIQSAISMVKKAANVAQDLSSLAPMIAKLFDAQSCIYTPICFLILVAEIAWVASSKDSCSIL